jgi:hypothetical protein
MTIISSTVNAAAGQSGVLIVSEPTLQNVLISLADTEQSVAIAASRKIIVNTRGNSTLRIAFTPGATTTNYRLLRAGFTYESPALDGSGITLYIQSPQAGETVEIESWV